MAMGIVSDKEFDNEVQRIPREESSSKSGYGEIVDSPSLGRPKGTVNTPNSLRKIIGETNEIEGRQSALDLANNFGVSPSSVSAYANGSTSTASYDERPNLNHINEAKEKISKRARSKLMKALNHITEDKLQAANPAVLSGVARDMSAIVKNMEPESVKNPASGASGPTFVFYAPQYREEKSFERIQAKE